MAPNTLMPCPMPSSASNLRANRRLAGAITVLLGALASVTAVRAADSFWDPALTTTTTGTGAGGGTWNIANTNWVTTAGTNVAFPSANRAVFGGAAGGVVTVADSFGAAGMLFNTTGYSLSAASAQTITSAGTVSLASSSVSATIGSNVTVSRATNDIITTASGTGGTLNIGAFGGSSTGAQYVTTQIGSTGGRTLSISGGAIVNVNSGGYFGQNAGTVYNTATTPNGTSIVIGADANGGSLVVKAGGTITNGNNQALILGGTATASSGNFTIDGGQVNSGTVTIGTSGLLPAASIYAGLRFGSGTMVSGTRTANLNGGTLTVGQIYASSVAVGTSTNTFNFNGGTLQASISNPTFMASGVATTANVKAGGARIDTNSFDVTIGQVLSHDTALGATRDGGLTKTGAGALTLSNANTYTGNTTVNVGTLTTSGNGTINASNAIIVNGSGAKFLHTNTTTAVSPTVTLTQGTLSGNGSVSTVNVGAGTGGVISNNNGVAGGALTIGTLTFSGAATVNTYSNSTSAAIVTTTLATNAAGTVTINPTASSWSNGNYDLISYAGSIGGAGFSKFVLGSVSGTSSRQNASLINSGTAVQLSIVSDYTYWTGGGDGKWNLASTNNWKLTSANTTTTFLAADDALFNDNATGAGPLSINIDTANVAPASTTFNNTTKDYSLIGAFGISGGTLTKTGTGNLTISTPNTYTGATAINGGTLTLSGNGTLGTGSALTLGGGNLNLGGTSQSVGAVSVTTAAASGDTISNGNLTGTSYAVSNAAGNVGISARLLANGSAGLAKTGNGTVTLSGANTYTGATAISGGALTLSGSGTLGTGSALTLGGGSLNLGGTSQSVGAVSVTTAAVSGDTIGNGSLTGTSYAASNVATTATISANLLANGTAGFTKTGNGTVILSGNNTYTGNTTVSAGALNVQSANALGSTAGSTSVAANQVLQLQGGVVFAAEPLNLLSNSGSNVALQNVSDNNEWTGTISSVSVSPINTLNISSDSGLLTVSGTMTSGVGSSTTGAPFLLRGAGNITVSGQITGLAGVTSSPVTAPNLLANPGVRTLTNNANNYTGLTTVTGGTLSFSSIKNADGSPSALGAPTNATNGTIAIGSGNTTGTLVYIGTGDTTDRILSLAGTTGNATIDQSGTGLLKFTSDLTVTGSGDKTLTLQGSTAGTGEISGAIVGSTTSLTKLGTGTWTLSGVNTYTGNTTVGAGALALNTNSTSSISVASGAALQLNLGNSLTTTGTLDLAAGATVTVIGTPVGATTYSLLSAASITGSPALSTPIAGFALVVDGSTLKLAPSAVSDTNPPVIASAAPASVNWGSTYTDVPPTATDNLDPSVTVITSGTVNTAKPGTYTLTYDATDAANNAATPVTRTVTVSILNPTTAGADGYTPLMRYALGANSPTETVQAPVVSANANTLVLTAVVRTDDPNLSVVGTTKTDLTSGTWATTGVSGSPAGSGTEGDQTGVITGQRRVYTVTTGSKTFLRLEATLAP